MSGVPCKGRAIPRTPQISALLLTRLLPCRAFSCFPMSEDSCSGSHDRAKGSALSSPAYRNIQARHFACRGRRARGSVINLTGLRGSGRRGSLAASSVLTIRKERKYKSFLQHRSVFVRGIRACFSQTCPQRIRSCRSREISLKWRAPRGAFL